MIDIKIFKVGKFKTNCYLLVETSKNIGVIIDPGGEIKNFEEKISSRYSIEYILITHGHFDHILNAEKYKSITDSKIVMSKLDAKFTSDNSLNLSEKFLRPNTFKDFNADIYVSDGDELLFLDKKIKILATPGHTKGSVCYILDNYIFSGDTLFCGDSGYTKFPTGNDDDMKNSLKKLYSLKEEYVIFPGHSKSSILSKERDNKTGLKKLV